MAGESSKGKANGLSKTAIPLDIDGHNLPPSPAPSSPHNGRKYALMTELVYTESSDQYNASSVPIYQVRQVLSYSTILSTCSFPDLTTLLVCNLQAGIRDRWRRRI